MTKQCEHCRSVVTPTVCNDCWFAREKELAKKVKEWKLEVARLTLENNELKRKNDFLSKELDR